MRKEEVLHRMKEGKNILQTIIRWKAKWIARIFCRNCLLKHLIEGKIEERILVGGRRRGRGKQLLNDLEKTESTGN